MLLGAIGLALSPSHLRLAPSGPSFTATPEPAGSPSDPVLLRGEDRGFISLLGKCCVQGLPPPLLGGGADGLSVSITALAPPCFHSPYPSFGVTHTKEAWSLLAGLRVVKLRPGFPQTPPALGRSQAQVEMEDYGEDEDDKDDEDDEDDEDDGDDGLGEGTEFSRFSLASEGPPER